MLSTLKVPLARITYSRFEHLHALQVESVLGRKPGILRRDAGQAHATRLWNSRLKRVLKL